MIPDLERRIDELRYLEGIEKVEHVPYPSGDEFWVRFNKPLVLQQIEDAAKKHDYRIVRFANLPSKLPRGLAEILWDGVTHVITKKISGLSNFKSKLGFEPEGIAKLAIDLHGPYRIYIATEEEGIQLLYEYLGVKYVPPPPPPPAPKPAAPAKPTAPVAAKPAQPVAPQPAARAVPATANPPQAAQPTQPKPATQSPSQTSPASKPAGSSETTKEPAKQTAGS